MLITLAPESLEVMDPVAFVRSAAGSPQPSATYLLAVSGVDYGVSLQAFAPVLHPTSPPLA